MGAAHRVGAGEVYRRRWGLGRVGKGKGKGRRKVERERKGGGGGGDGNRCSPGRFRAAAAAPLAGDGDDRGSARWTCVYVLH